MPVEVGYKVALRMHDRRKKDWTHFSFFEVHDNVTSDEIRELEALLLGIFRDDQRIELANKQKGSRKLHQRRAHSAIGLARRRTTRWASRNQAIMSSQSGRAIP